MYMCYVGECVYVCYEGVCICTCAMWECTVHVKKNAMKLI